MVNSESIAEAIGDSQNAVMEQLARSERPVLFCHRSPDGDTVGAALALARALQSQGKEVAISCADPLPQSLHFMPGIALIKQTIPANPDLLVTIDSSDPSMLGGLRDDLDRLRGSLGLVNIDHHASDPCYGDVNLVDTAAASTAEIIFDLLVRMNMVIDRDIATCLLTGIINDTHSYQNSNASERAFTTSAVLVAAGADPAVISFNLLLRKKPEAALLWGKTLGTLQLDDGGRVASATSSQQMLKESGAELSHLDGIVEFLRAIDGVDLAFLMKEVGDKQFKLSIRTSALIDAVELTAPFAGGGHRRAAGCDIEGTVEDVRAQVLSRYHELLGGKTA